MKKKQKVQKQEIFGSVFLLAGKFLLAAMNPLGWLCNIIGYSFVWDFNRRKKDMEVLVALVTGLICLSFYGAYKWRQQIEGIFLFDKIVLTVTLAFCIWLAYKKFQSKRPLWLPQIIGSVSSIIGFTSIGLGHIEGWYCMVLGHSCIGYTYYRKDSTIFVALQAISWIIAACASQGISLIHTIIDLFWSEQVNHTVPFFFPKKKQTSKPVSTSTCLVKIVRSSHSLVFVYIHFFFCFIPLSGNIVDDLSYALWRV